MILLVFTAGTAIAARDSGAPPPDAYMCSAADRKFIDVARVNLPSFAAWRSDYVAGGVDHATFVAVARETGSLVERTEPHDRSLGRARLLTIALVSEYARAASERERGELGASALLHAQELDASLRGHLAGAASGLAAVGCDVSPLFAA